jgi:hypothetical protein
VATGKKRRVGEDETDCRAKRLVQFDTEGKEDGEKDSEDELFSL